MLALHTILHPTDFSPNAEYALRLACSLARDYDARLVLLHVSIPPSGPIEVLPPNPNESAESQELLLGKLPWPETPDAGVRVEHRVAEGQPADEILRLARKVSCDLIVMGTHGRTGLNRLLHGSVAEEVLRKAPCPVLSVHLPAPPS
jgi:nucleotide-binding universal stress UspA family protein